MQDIESIMINDMRELILRIMIGSKDGYTRNQIIDILEKFTNKKYPRTTVYDNIYPFLKMGILGKKEIPMGKGRPFVVFYIINKTKANRLMEYVKTKSHIKKDVGKVYKRYEV